MAKINEATDVDLKVAEDLTKHDWKREKENKSSTFFSGNDDSTELFPNKRRNLCSQS